MRTQTSKNSPKKGFSSKSSLKSPTKAAKKKNVSPKKVSQPLKRSLIKIAKKNSNKNVGANKDGSKDDNMSSNTEHLEASTPTSSRSQSPSKKVKKEKKRMTSAVSKIDVGKRIDGKKNEETPFNVAVKQKNKTVSEAKYKINTKSAKRIVRPLKNTNIATRKGKLVSLKEKKTNKITKVKTHQTSPSIETSVSSDIYKLSPDPDLEENSSQLSESSGNIAAHSNLAHFETHKTDGERTPKFFTSSRSPRSLDVDVKSLKSCKGAIPDRLISPKCTDHTSGESPNLVTQGPDMDVYTFTEKVDSPKNILSDFRDVSTKNVGKVRPIARVKGTVIDKKQDTEKNKFSPHRPIEEVVKKLKANKKTDDTKLHPQKSIETINAKNEPIATIESGIKAIVSKSYKMVARKTSIPGKPFSPITFLDNKEAKKGSKCKITGSKKNIKVKKEAYESEDELETSKFSLSSNVIRNFSTDESASESNDDNDFKDSSGSEEYKVKKSRTQATKKGQVGSKKMVVSRELRELAKGSGSPKDNPKKKRMTLLSMWTEPKKHRMASLNAIAKVHCLYENESRTHMELGLMKTVDRPLANQVKPPTPKKKDFKTNDKILKENTSESEFEKKEKAEESSEEESIKNTRCLRGEPGIRSAGKYWDPKFSTSSSEDSELESIRKVEAFEKKRLKNKPTSDKSDSDKPSKKAKQTKGVPVKKRRNRNEVVLDLKDMVVHKRMASLNATAILAASYEKRSPKSSKDETTSDSCSDESFSSNSKNGVASGSKPELKNKDLPKDGQSSLASDRKQKVEVIVNQDTDVTITGVYSTHHHDGFCVSGMQYRISSTSHTQTTATSNCEKESARDDESRYTPLSALSSMKPPADKPTPHTADLGGLSRRPGGTSAFSAPSSATSASHHEPGYYQPAGPLIKETAADGGDRALARYHPPPHYHPPHPPVLQQYGSPYYPSDMCYGQYYRPAGPYHMRPLQPPDAPMVGVRSEPYPSPPYYGAPPCYQHSPQRLPYLEYRGCPCPMNSYPKNVVIGPATGKAPTGGGPGLPHSGAAFRPKARAALVHSIADNHAAGKDPPLVGEPPPTAADAPRPCALPLSLGGASPKRELFEFRAAVRLAGESAGPPSPARGSAGASVPQPPPAAAPPRRARLGKDAARRSLAPDDTALLLQPTPTSPDVLAITPPPPPPPIDLSSDERSTPLIDVKKENEGPAQPAHKKNDALALREHNSSTTNDIKLPEKPVKRRYSKPQLHIDMKEVALEETCKTNGIGEHVKLQKRRKISSEQIEISEPKKPVTPKTKRTLKTTEAKPTKRKLLDTIDDLHMKRLCAEQKNDAIARLAEANTPEPETHKKPAVQRPRNKSALLLDNLIRKNSVDSKNISIDNNINPAELFLPKLGSLQTTTKTALNINNNVIENQSQPSNAESNSPKPKITHRKSVTSWYLHDKHRRKSVAYKDSDEPVVKEDKDTCPNKASAETLSRISPTREETVSPLRISMKKCEKPLKSKKSKLCNNEKVDIERCEKQMRVTDSQCIATCPTKDIIKPDSNGQLDQLPRSKLEGKSNGEVKLKCEKVSEKAKLYVSKKRHSIEEREEIETVEVEEVHCQSLVVQPRKGRRRGGGRKARRLTCIPPQIADPRAPPRWSNGWQWDGEFYFSRVYLNNDSRSDRTARCWSRMRHASGDHVARGDCVLLRASSARAQPFVARVAKLWENPDDSEMMVSLVWYYRPEHTEQGRTPEDAPDEVFASRHRDANSVACIEDKCYVLTYNEYCRYRKRLKALEEGIIVPSIVPPLMSSEVSPAIATNDSKLPAVVSPDLVLFCRKIYDFRSKKLQVPTK